MSNKKIKLLTIGAAIFFLVIIAISIFFIIRNNVYSATLYLEFTPLSSSVKLEGDYTQGGFRQGSNRIRPGQYTVTISKDGFADYTETFSIVGKADHSVLVILEPNREDTMNWYETHPEDNAKKIELAGIIDDPNEEKTQTIIQEDVPRGITFPIYGPGWTYKIYSGESPTRPDRFALFAEYYNEEGLELLNQRIKNFSSNGAKYEVIYENKIPPEETHN